MDKISAVCSRESFLVLDESPPLSLLKREDGCEGSGQRP